MLHIYTEVDRKIVISTLLKKKLFMTHCGNGGNHREVELIDQSRQRTLKITNAYFAIPKN